MTITITAVALTAMSPQIRLDVTSSPVVTGSMTIVRIHADGSEHRVLGVGSLIETWAGIDLHAPTNAPVTYRVTVGAQTATSAPVLMLSDQHWMVHRSDPDLSLAITGVGPVAPRSRASRATKYEPLNGKLPVYRTDVARAGRSGEVQVVCWTPEDLDAVTALLADDAPVLLNTVTPLGWLWVQPGTTSETFAGGGYVRDETIVTIPWDECAAPDADAGVWTLDELDAHAVTAYPTLDDLDAAYAGLTLADLDLRAI